MEGWSDKYIVPRWDAWSFRISTWNPNERHDCVVVTTNVCITTLYMKYSKSILHTPRSEYRSTNTGNSRIARARCACMPFPLVRIMFPCMSNSAWNAVEQEVRDKVLRCSLFKTPVTRTRPLVGTVLWEHWIHVCQCNAHAHSILLFIREQKYSHLVSTWS